MNLLEIGKILRPHGVKGAVKVECYLDEHFSMFKEVMITTKLAKSNVKSVQNLNNGFYIVTFDVIPTIDVAEKFRNESIYIDRDCYKEFKEKVYFADLIGKAVINENNEKIGVLVDFDDYGASVILTIRCGAVSYQIPYVTDIINFVKEKDAYVIEQKTFNNVKV